MVGVLICGAVAVEDVLDDVFVVQAQGLLVVDKDLVTRCVLGAGLGAEFPKHCLRLGWLGWVRDSSWCWCWGFYLEGFACWLGCMGSLLLCAVDNEVVGG